MEKFEQFYKQVCDDLEKNARNKKKSPETTDMLQN